jgi:hypothetical protein
MTYDETLWSFSTARFRVSCEICEEPGYRYDGDDEDGETQRMLDDGELIAFATRVGVFLDGVLIGADYLGGSVYSASDYKTFTTAHRDPDPMNRNCSIMRASHPAGPNVSICHYFPDMVRQAVSAARDYLADMPHLRGNAA